MLKSSLLWIRNILGCIRVTNENITHSEKQNLLKAVWSTPAAELVAVPISKAEGGGWTCHALHDAHLNSTLLVDTELDERPMFPPRIHLDQGQTTLCLNSETMWHQKSTEILLAQVSFSNGGLNTGSMYQVTVSLADINNLACLIHDNMCIIDGVTAVMTTQAPCGGL